ncbi:MAG: ABC transporter permease [Firmicutes bacterium]|jgi:ribose/xylose/arabinose/galactoside ABC-type transport system permease subunit|nr:ABC transporter permease [Bacillota bacterium]
MSKKFSLAIIDNMIWVINLILFIIFLLIEPKLILPKNIVSMIYSVSMLGFLIFAQAIVLISGNFDMSVGAIAGFSATVVAAFYEFWFPGTPWLILVIISLATGTLIGIYNGFMVGKLNINPFLQTLASHVLFYGLMLIIGGRTMFKLPRQYLSFGGGFVGDSILPVSVVALIIAAIIIHIILTRTTLGRQIFAIGSNRIAAKTCGINVENTLVKVFAISGFISAVAGIMYTGYMSCVTMDMAQPDLFLTFAGAILGGVAIAGGSGKISGVFGGIVFLGIMEIGLTMLKTRATWREPITGIILAIAVVLNTYQGRLKGHVLAKESERRIEKERAEIEAI